MKKGLFTVSTSQKMEFIDITAGIEKEISKAGIQDGICYLYNPHTTAGLTINEGADPAVQVDIISVLQKIVPPDHHYKHMEGNSPSHLMTSLIGTSATVFVEGGRLALGRWQRIFFCEFDGPRTRKLLWRILQH